MKRTFLFLCFLFVLTPLFSQNFHSKYNGEWSSPIWGLDNLASSTSFSFINEDLSMALPCLFFGADSLFINHQVSTNFRCSSLEFSAPNEKTVIILRPGSELHCNNLILNGSYQIIVQENAALWVDGYLSMNAAANIQVDGILHIKGNVTMTLDSQVWGSGQASYEGIPTFFGGAKWMMETKSLEDF